jgi:hypothetical protein
VENRVDEWASLRCGKAEVMLSLPNEHIPFEEPKFTGSFYFFTLKKSMRSGRNCGTKLQSCIRLRISTMECASLRLRT